MYLFKALRKLNMKTYLSKVCMAAKIRSFIPKIILKGIIRFRHRGTYVCKWNKLTLPWIHVQTSSGRGYIWRFSYGRFSCGTWAPCHRRSPWSRSCTLSCCSCGQSDVSLNKDFTDCETRHGHQILSFYFRTKFRHKKA